MGQTWSRTQNVTADSNGNINDQFNLPDWFVATYKVDTKVMSSGTVVTSSFTDAPKDDTATTLSRTSGTNPSSPGASLTFKATVQRLSGTATPTGDIDFLDQTAGTHLCDKVALSGSAGTATASCSTTARNTGGDHTIRASYKGDSNFNTSNSSLTQTVTATKPKLTVTCDNKSRDYGAANPTLTATITGFQGSDTQANSTTGAPSCTTSANATSPVSGSPYTITASQGTLASSKYDFTFVNGALTVDKKAATVTADNQTITYGQADPAFTFQTTGVLSGDTLTGVSCDVPVAHAHARSYDITRSGNTNNYTVTYNKGTLTVGEKELNVTADNQTKTLGQSDPSFTFTYSGFVSGEGASVIGTAPTCSVSGAHNNVGTYAITCSGGADNNYSFKYVDGTLKIQYAATGTCLGSAGHTILQPVNADGSSLFKQGSTVPAKFRVCDANGNSIGTPDVVTSFRLIKAVSGLDFSPVDKAVVSTTPDTAFRWSAADQWIFNINTKSKMRGVGTRAGRI